MNNQTYKMMSKVAELVEETEEKELIRMYQNGQENQALAKVFVLNYGMICKINNKYQSIEQEVADSIALESLDICLKEFDIEGTARLSSFFNRVYKNKLINTLRRNQADKRTIDRESNSIEGIKQATEGNFGVTYEDNSLYYEDNNLDINFNDLDFLTPNEKKILNEYKKCDFKANQQDIADRLNVNKSSVSRAISRLSDKLPLIKEELL